MRNIIIFLCLFSAVNGNTQTTAPAYPYPVNYFHLYAENRSMKMAYMDVIPAQPNGKSILLLHGKNFNGYYWKDVISFLSMNGYRVIVPDQVGWGKSDKPDIHYSFHLLASQTKALLDSLRIKKVCVIGHSMGGMLAIRFTIMYPETVDKFILENPIGLEDYKTFIPYHSPDKEFETEIKANYDSLKKYQQGYYPVWKPEYEQYVAAQYASLQVPDVKQATWASSLTYEMIYEQPVLYEFNKIATPALLIIGQADRTIVGKGSLSKEEAAKHGNYPELGKWLHQQIRNSQLVELDGVGHIPHVQALPEFEKQVLNFLKK